VAKWTEEAVAGAEAEAGGRLGARTGAIWRTAPEGGPRLAVGIVGGGIGAFLLLCAAPGVFLS
jgi:hypothetical protein